MSTETFENNQHNYLQELKGSDFEIADHQPNITGWEIVDGNGHELGEVRDLIFDCDALKIRYIVSHVDVDLNHDGDDELLLVLIPIGIVQLDEKSDKVIVPQSYASIIDFLPPYEPGHLITPGEELAVRKAFLGNATCEPAEAVAYDEHPEDFYLHEHFDDANLKTRNLSVETFPSKEII